MAIKGINQKKENLIKVMMHVASSRGGAEADPFIFCAAKNNVPQRQDPETA
jgi:hypothetical protein